MKNTLLHRLKRVFFVSYRLMDLEHKIHHFVTPQPSMIVAPEPESTLLKNAYTQLVRLIAPCKALHHEMRRFGSLSDGGYLMLDDFSTVTAAYSLGVGQDISWDHAMAERGIPVYQFDHTVKNLPYSHPRFHFFPRQIGAVDDATTNTVTLGTLIRERGHAGRDLLLKIDIEDAEWEVFDQIDSAVLNQFRQIVGEFHGFQQLLDPVRYERMMRVLTKLTQNHRVVHVHANNTAIPLSADNVLIPDVLELTFVRADFYELEESFELFPHPLDRPNDPARKEIEIGTFRY